MSEPQHPQSEGTQTSAGRGAPVPHTAPGAAYAPLDSLAAVGARLAQLREARGWSVDDVSARLKVSPGKMRALEAGDISQLPGTTFAIGVIRSYAKMLGTDPEPFAQALRRVKGASEPDLSMPASTGADLPRGRVSVSLGGTQKHRSWWWGVGAGVIIVIALAMWHQGGDSSAWLARLKASAGGMAANPGGTASGVAAPTSASAATSGGLVVAQSPASATVASATVASAAAASGPSAEASAPMITPLEPTAQPSASEASGGQAASAGATASAPAPAAVQAQTAAPMQGETAAQAASAAASGAQAAAASGASGAATIAVKVSQDSWFSVRDKNGKEVFSGLVHAGDTKEISGLPPLKVVAGNRAGLESMTLDGQPVDAAKFGPNKGNVVRFTLP